MKFHVEFINDIKSGSHDSVHSFCLFEALDSTKNMWLIFKQFREFLYELQKPNYHLCGKQVKVFLGGDYHFLSDMIGHQGQSATYPSISDLVMSSHLRKHAGTPHCPPRTVKDYHSNYIENLTDVRQKVYIDSEKRLRDHGSDHNSVINDMLFPISDLLHIVPPILHIHLGVVLNLYNLLEKTCKEIDLNQIPLSNTITQVKKLLEEQIAHLDFEFEELDKKCRCYQMFY